MMNNDKILNLNENFLFSVIIPFYNVEQYLTQTIESVISQSLDFNENVELILVDDGSSDSSLSTAQKYCEKYPDNTILLTHKHINQAHARNMGLKNATGKIIAFLDGDDYLSENSLENVYNFYKENDDINIVAIPITFFESKNNQHALNYRFDDEDKIINLDTESNDPQINVTSTFIKRDVINVDFDEDLIFSDDFLFINKLLLDERRYGLTSKATYFKRNRFDNTSLSDNIVFKKKYYTDRLINVHQKLIDYSYSRYGELPLFIQYAIIYELKSLLEISDLDVFDNSEEREEFWQTFQDVLKKLDEKVISKNTHIRQVHKTFLFYVKNRKYSIDKEDDEIVLRSGDYVIDKLTVHRIWLDIIEIDDNKLNISGLLLTNFNLDSLKINLIKECEGKKTVIPCEYVFYPQDERKPLTFLSIPWRFDYNFNVSVDLEKDKLARYSFEVIFDEEDIDFSFNPQVEYRITTGFSELSIYSVKDSSIIFHDTHSVSTVPYSYFKMVKFEIKSLKRLLKCNRSGKYSAVMMHILYLILYPFMRNKKIWLINDRLDSADDNAKHLFRYACKQNDGITKYFIIDKDSKDYPVVKKINKNVLKYGSFKHKLLYLYCDKRISSFLNEMFFNPFYNKETDHREFYSNLVTAPRYFLQHGVISCDLTKHIKRFNHNLALIVTSSDLERQSFFDLDYNYPKNVVQALGLPRYDNLKRNTSKKQIVYLPSWRSYLDKSGDMFVNSNYYLSINSLINNKRLHKILEQNGYEFIFKPHPELVKHIDKFNTENITISINDSFQDIFNDSSILISDFSSVIFDFSYLKKPVIYYQPNDDYHYEQGYFDYESMGFGDIIKNESELIDKIEYYIENDCKMEDKYQQRVKSFFKYNDTNNSKRVYDWIKNN